MSRHPCRRIDRNSLHSNLRDRVIRSNAADSQAQMLNTLNQQFLYIFGIAIFVLIVGWEVLSRLFGNTPFAQSLNFILFGFVFLAGDIIARRRDTEPFTWLSIFNSYRGGAFGWVPCWLVGIGFIGGGIASLVQ